MEFLNRKNHNKGGIYFLRNLVNERFYVGSTVFFRSRWSAHKKALEGGFHPNSFLQRDYKKSGGSNFVFEIREVFRGGSKREKLFELEQEYLNKFYDKQKKCYNLTKHAIVPIEHIIRNAIFQIDPKTGEKIRSWDSAATAGKELGISDGCIRNACKGHLITYKGFKWRFADEELAKKYKPKERLKKDPRKVAVVVVDPKKFAVIKEFPSRDEAARELKVIEAFVRRVTSKKTYEYIQGNLMFGKEDFSTNKEEIQKYFLENFVCECKICELRFKSLRSLASHIQFSHNMSAKAYTIKYLLKQRPSCLECEEEPRYISFSFKKYCKEHAKIAMKVGGKKKGIKAEKKITAFVAGFENDPELYGSSKGIIKWKKSQLTQENCKRFSAREKKKIAKELFEYFRNNGFPYPHFSNVKLQKEWENLCSQNLVPNQKILSNKKVTGNKLWQHFNSKNFFSVSEKGTKKSMVEAFNNDATLTKVIENRLGLTYKETFNIHGAMLRQGFRSTRSCAPTSIFNCLVAKFIYDSFTKPGELVLDYSAGFGQRMLGALASKNNLSYIGCDPWKDVIDANKSLAKYLKEGKRTILINKGAEFFRDPKYQNKISFAFSSPPYFNKEVYDDNNRFQAYSGKKNVQEFVDVWWEEVVKNISFLLDKEKGTLAINMLDNELLTNMLTICKKHGFEEFDRYSLEMSKSHFDKNRNPDVLNKREPIVILRRK